MRLGKGEDAVVIVGNAMNEAMLLNGWLVILSVTNRSVGVKAVVPGTGREWSHWDESGRTLS